MFIFQASPQSHRALGALRIIVGLLFLLEGTMKWFGYPPPPAPLPAMTMPSLLGFAGLLEMFGGLAITFGLLTRPVAFILSGEMAVVYFHTHFPHGFFPVTNNGMPAVLFCFMFLYLAFAGSGAWALDNALARAWAQRTSHWQEPWLPGLPGRRTARPARIRTR